MVGDTDVAIVTAKDSERQAHPRSCSLALQACDGPGVSYALIECDFTTRLEKAAMNLVGLLLVFCGLFAIAGSVCEWEWFFNHPKARLIAAIFGRTGTRVFYVVLGGGLAVFGFLMCLGMLPSELAAG